MDAKNSALPDLMSEQLRTFGQLAAMLPSRCPGKKTAASTVARYALKGSRGIKLESIRIGGQRVSSVEALGRFIQALNVTDDRHETAVPQASPRPTVARRKAVDQAEAELVRAGF